MTSTVEGTSRVTIVAPGTQLDLALPADVPLADLLPALLRHAGEELADDGVEHQGWVLRRLGGLPLETGRTPAQLDLRDGEMLYFTPRADAPPEVVFDDVVDAVATGTQRRRGRWAIADTRRTATWFTLAAMVGGLAAVLFAGPPQRPGSLIAIGLGVVLLTVATLVSRVGGDSRTGALFGLVAVGYGAVGGLLLLAGERDLPALAAPHLLVTATFLLVFGAVATLGVGDYPQVFLGTAAAGVALGAAAGICLAFGAGPAVAAAVVSTVTFGSIPAYPMLSYRLAGLPVPSIPTGPEDLKTDTSSVEGRRVLALSDRATEYLSGLIHTASLVVLTGIVVIVLQGGWQGRILATLLSVLLMLRARPVPGRSHRFPVLVAGAAGLGAVATAAFVTAGLGGRLGLILAGLAFAALISAVYGLVVAGRRLSPVWGRLLDVIEILLIVALVPVAGWVAGLYGWVATVGR